MCHVVAFIDSVWNDTLNLIVVFLTVSHFNNILMVKIKVSTYCFFPNQCQYLINYIDGICIKITKGKIVICSTTHSYIHIICNINI